MALTLFLANAGIRSKSDLASVMPFWQLLDVNWPQTQTTIMSAQSEKTFAAFNSVAAAFSLTALKVVVGIFSGSVGILAEAAHSGLDCIAALLTLFAVHASGKAPDPKHPYGHGKIESISAMAEALLLLLTCVWIVRESIHRLTVVHPPVQATLWAFAVVVVSIVVDITRSRMLYHAATKHKSQALEADALHFSTDVWSSGVVLLGLAGVKTGQWFPSLVFLEKADAIAALFVAAIVIVVSARLGWRTIEGLLDTAPAGVIEHIRREVEGLQDVVGCHAVRVRQSGPRCFVDLHVILDGNMSLRAAHDVTDVIEQVVVKILPDADVTVHPEPTALPPAPSKNSPPTA